MNAAARLSLQVFDHLAETDDLRVLMHAGGEIGPQMNQVFLNCGVNVIVRRGGLQPNSNTATGDQLQTHRTGTNPDVFLLGVLDALISALVLRHLQGATERHCWLVYYPKELQVTFSGAA